MYTQPLVETHLTGTIFLTPSTRPFQHTRHSISSINVTMTTAPRSFKTRYGGKINCLYTTFLNNTLIAFLRYLEYGGTFTSSVKSAGSSPTHMPQNCFRTY